MFVRNKVELLHPSDVSQRGYGESLHDRKSPSAPRPAKGQLGSDVVIRVRAVAVILLHQCLLRNIIFAQRIRLHELTPPLLVLFLIVLRAHVHE